MITFDNIKSGKLSLDTTIVEDYDPILEEPSSRYTLTELADIFGSDKGSIKHNYTNVYENILSSLRFSHVRLVEVGIACGASLKMWSNYFSNGEIIGADINEDCKKLCSSYKNVEIRIKDATLETVAEQFDIFVDDGSHISKDILSTFNLHWAELKSGGWYFIEDLRCTHNEEYKQQTVVQKPDEYFDRRYFLKLIDAITKACDNRWDVAQIIYTPQLISIKKA